MRATLIALTSVLACGLVLAEGLNQLKLHEVGRYSELSSRPNPQNFVILTVPDIDTLIAVLTKERGKRFTPEEIAEMKKNAASIVLTSAEAVKMKQARDKRL